MKLPTGMQKSFKVYSNNQASEMGGKKTKIKPKQTHTQTLMKQTNKPQNQNTKTKPTNTKTQPQNKTEGWVKNYQDFTEHNNPDRHGEK